MTFKVAQWDPKKTAGEVINAGQESISDTVQNVGKGDIGAAVMSGGVPTKVINQTQGAHNTNMGNIANAYHTSVTDQFREMGRQGQKAKDDLIKDAEHAAQVAADRLSGSGNYQAPSVSQLGSVGAGLPGMGGPGGGAGGAGGPAAITMPTKPQAGFAVPTAIAGQQIQFDPTKGYATNAQNAQQGLMDALVLQSQGKGPSVAEGMLRQGQEANLAATMAQLASARGGANPLMARTAMNTASDIQAKTAQDMAMARLQEQLQAQGLLGQVSNNAATQGLQQRQQDIGLATNQAGLNQETALAGYNAAVDSAKTGYLNSADLAKANAELQTKYMSMGLDAQKANQLAALELEKLKAATASADRDMWTKIYGGGATGIAQIGAAAVSDENLKTDIQQDEKGLEEFLGAINQKKYRYKDEKHGQGTYISPMAQELEKTELGRHMVINTPEGKMVNYARAAGTILSAQSMILRRLKELEGRGRKK